MNDTPRAVPTPSASSAARRGRTSRSLFVLAGVAGLIFVLYISTRIFGGVTGEEFSPDSFQRREFAYFEIPLIHLQITPISRTDATNSLEHYVAGQKLIPVKTGAQCRWDLVRAQQGALAARHGDAGILCAYLDAVDDEGNLVWKTWTEENTPLAKILWPAIDRLADQRLYLLVPEVFALASRAGDAKTFQDAVDRVLADRYEDLARAQRELGNRETALELAAEGLRHAPQRRTLQQLHDQLQTGAQTKES